MKTASPAEKIVTARKSKGFSQADLAGLAQVNLRTIQRIESGKTVPRGYTLQLIAKALDCDVAGLTAPAPDPEADRSLLWLNLSALALLVLPYGNLIVPLLVWHNKKQALQPVKESAGRIINFQILWSVALSLGLVVTIFVQAAVAWYFNIRLVFALWIVFLVMYGINILAILFYGSRIKKGNNNIYPVGISIF